MIFMDLCGYCTCWNVVSKKKQSSFHVSKCSRWFMCIKNFCKRKQYFSFEGWRLNFVELPYKEVYLAKCKKKITIFRDICHIFQVKHFVDRFVSIWKFIFLFRNLNICSRHIYRQLKAHSVFYFYFRFIIYPKYNNIKA